MDAVEIDTSRPSRAEDAIASTVKICRVCLLDNLMMRDLFLENDAASLSTKAMSFINVKVSCVPLRLATDATLGRIISVHFSFPLGLGLACLQLTTCDPFAIFFMKCIYVYIFWLVRYDICRNRVRHLIKKIEAIRDGCVR